MPSTLSDYKPTFFQPIKGCFQENSNFYTHNIATDAYVTEREYNELHWLIVDNAAKTLREIAKSGFLTTSDKKGVKCIEIINNDKNHLNSFDLTPFKTIHNGFLTNHVNYKINEPMNQNITIRLPNPPVGGYRHDFVYIEFWFAELKKNDKVPKYGYIQNDSLDYNIIDERVGDETSRRIQLQWKISHYEDFDDWCENGFIKPDGKPNEKIHPLAQTGYLAKDYHYAPTDYDEFLYRSGEGIIKNQKIRTMDGYIYAIPMFNILRYNNSGFDAKNNPWGGIDYVDDARTPNADRPDGKYSNIIYSDLVKDLRHLSPVSEKQYDKLYVRFEEYYNKTKVLRNKLDKLTHDIEMMKNALRNIDIDIPSIYDKEIYGVNMSHQWGITDGGMIDPMDDTKRVAYHKHNKYYLSKNMVDKKYALVTTLIDYDYEDKGSLGDLYIDKYTNKFRVYNTGARGLRMNFEAFEVDDSNVYSGDGLFSGMDGTVITMPFKMDDDRHFVHIVAESNENGRNGEVFVKFVDNQFIVYNTGLKTNNHGVITPTTGNKFQWTIVDMYAKPWKNINYMNVTLAGQEGVQVSSREFGEKYRLSIGTPIITAAMTIEQGSIGDIYADVDEDDIFTVCNTGGSGAMVQCLVLNEVQYKEYYDTREEENNDPSIPNIVLI